MLEVTGVARGMVVCDALVKRAAVQVLRSNPIDPGKYLIVFAGPVAELEEAMEAGEEAAGTQLLDRLLLPYVHEAVIPAVAGRNPAPEVDSIGIVELHTLAGTIVALDVALKAALVTPIECRLGAGLGGKGYFVLTGELHDVEAAVEAAVSAVGNDAISEVIARPHPDFIDGALR
jgi:microcompartment protein CcmL/EutN